MKAPRFRINWLMGCIALAALNLGVMRLLEDLGLRLIALTHTDRFYHMIETLVVGALPMLNVLGIVLVIGLRRRCSHRSLWGFVLFGSIALALYVAAATSYPDELLRPFSKLLRPIVVALRDGQGSLSAENVLILKSIAALILFLPQLAFALVGVFLSHFRISVTVEWRDRPPSDGLCSH
jgi:hypothetical protein